MNRDLQMCRNQYEPLNEEIFRERSRCLRIEERLDWVRGCPTTTSAKSGAENGQIKAQPRQNKDKSGVTLLQRSDEELEEVGSMPSNNDEYG